MEHSLWADRGQLLRYDAPARVAKSGCIVVSRLDSARLSGDQFSIWVQVRGSSWVDAKEGKFRLRRGEWIAFEKDSMPCLQADQYGLCIGLTLTPEALRGMLRLADCSLYPGRGRASASDVRGVLKQWRQAKARLDPPDAGQPAATALLPIALHLASIQSGMAEAIERCPGRSRHRKRQVFGRMQRARLYLEGNCDRVVRVGELAELTSFSSWYFSKTFHALYDETPQASAARMRLARAADLLERTSMMIGEVAAASGFDNCCSFARAFRARYGKSATRFRAAAAAVPAPAKEAGAERKAA